MNDPELCAWFVNVDDGNADGTYKYGDNYVHAVSAF